jgi:glycerate 2-kinase
MQADRFLTRSLRDLRIARTLAEALNAVEPYHLVSNFLQQHPLQPHKRLFLLGLGKAAEGMTRAAAAQHHISGALVITKQASTPSLPLPSEPDRLGNGSVAPPSTTVLEAGHPIPDVRSLAAGRAAVHFVSNLQSDDLLLCLISGGGSALVAAPAPGVSLADLQTVTDALIRSGATIEEMNVIRRRLDILKGGGLAACTRASILSLILSDVVGDRLEAIASGPTAPEPATLSSALSILQKYRIRPNESIAAAMRQSRAQQDPAIFARIRNIIIGNNQTAIEAALRHAELEGFQAQIVANNVQGEARTAGQHLAAMLNEAAVSKSRPFCMLAGGETTVTLRAAGKGGRNQEVTLAAVDALDGRQDVCFVSLATDGEDGPTDAAGAVVTGESLRRSVEMGMAASDYLARHDAYPFFDALDDLLQPGSTGTNVNDLMLLVGL